MRGHPAVYVEAGEEYAAFLIWATPTGEASIAICAPPGSALYTRGRSYTDEVQWKYRTGVPYDVAFRPPGARNPEDLGVPPTNEHWRPA